MESDHVDDSDDATDVPYLISNLAVLEILQKRVDARKGRKSSGKQLQHRDWVEQNVVAYLKGTACKQFRTAANASALQKVLRSNKKTRAADGTVSTGFDLTEAESLQILNLAPTEPVEIHLLVEELHDRMTARKQEELLATIQSYRMIPQENGKHAAATDYVEALDNGEEDGKPAAKEEE